MSSWKEIAAFFDKDVRTVRRWEATRRLPVHRVPGGGRSGVFAYRSELEQWLKTAAADDVDADAEFSEELPVFSADTEDLGGDTEGGTGSEVELIEPAEPIKGGFLRRHAAALGGAVAVGITAMALLTIYLRHDWEEHRALSVPRETRGTPSSNAQAQELYLRGLYFWNQRTESSLTDAVDLFTQSIVLDPHFAAAYAGLADSYILIRQYGHMRDGEAFPRALAASRQALALDDSSHEAHRAYAFILNYWMWNFPEAQREFERAIELNPNDAQTHSWYATSLYSVGRYDDALREIDTARRLSPDSTAILANRGLLLTATDPAAGLAYLQDLARANPDSPTVHTYLGGAYFGLAQYRQYLEECARAAALRKDTAESSAIVQFQRELERHGAQAMFSAQAEFYGKHVDQGGTAAMQAASIYARLGQEDRALHYLEVAYDRRESTFLLINQDSVYRPLEGRPEFKKLMVERNTPMDLASALKVNGAVGETESASR